MAIVLVNRAIGKSDARVRQRIFDVTTICDRASRLLDSYRLNIKGRGFSAVRQLILDDIRRFADLGADAYVADLRKALFRLEDEESEPACLAVRLAV
jgi:hypothetical protein